MADNLLYIVCDLLRQHDIRDFVLCPGTRNAPLTEALSTIEGNRFKVVLDERSAGFVAIGMAQALGRPVAVCCTSGSAVANLYPAVVEAYYQQVPIVLLTADRPNVWIDQLDGQTIRQENIFSPHIRFQANCKEVSVADDFLYNNRIINQALLRLTKFPFGAVHINIPIDNPYQSIDRNLILTQRKISIFDIEKKMNLADLIPLWKKSNKRMIVLGQHSPNSEWQRLLGKLSERQDVVLLGEHISNSGGRAIHIFDQIIQQEEEVEAITPNLVIYLGGHITSKHLKQLLRQAAIDTNIYVGGEECDLFGSMTHFIESDSMSFLSAFLEQIEPCESSSFVDYWKSLSIDYKPLVEGTTLYAINNFISSMKPDSILHLANSQTIRNVEQFDLPDGIQVFCNKGTNGIEGSLSTAVGTALATDRQVYLIIGDLSFMYDMNALTIKDFPNNLSILVINNSGGDIFRNIVGVKDFSQIDTVISYRHVMQFRGYCDDVNIQHYSISNADDIANCLVKTNNKSICIEFIVG